MSDRTKEQEHETKRYEKELKELNKDIDNYHNTIIWYNEQLLQLEEEGNLLDVISKVENLSMVHCDDKARRLTDESIKPKCLQNCGEAIESPRAHQLSYYVNSMTAKNKPKHIFTMLMYFKSLVERVRWERPRKQVG